MQQGNQLILGDCLEALRPLADATVHLVYLDPPFNTNTRRMSPSPRRAGGVRERRLPHAPAYDDSFGSPSAYIAYMRPRVEQMCRVLAPDGSLFFHCDWRMSHHVRLMLDDVFGLANEAGRTAKEAVHSSSAPSRDSGQFARPSPGTFVNEIIWHYGLGAARARRQLLTKHDVIFWYANSRQYTFNVVRAGATPAMLAKYRHVDEQGNRYMNSYGKRYLLKGGKPLDDVWDIPAIAPTASERAGYPTQKPLALLARIVQLASNAGDLVLDPFCGSGTTLVAAQQFDRRWIGMDANPQAIEIARRRLPRGEV